MRKYIFIILTLILVSCYYTMENTRLKNIDNLYLKQIVNDTEEHRINDYLTDNFTKILINNTKLNLTSKEKSDAILEIKVKKYDKEIVAIDINDNPVSEKIILELSYKFYREDKVIDENKNYNFEYNYRTKEDRSDDYYIERAMISLAADLKSEIIEGF